MGRDRLSVGDGAAPRVTLYTRPGCHLCDEARARLLDLRAAGARFELREVDIERDERLHAAMLERIPVIELEGERVSELWLDEDALRRRLDTVPPMEAPRPQEDR